MIIQFPDAGERDRLLIVRKVAAALREYLANGPKSASACRRISDKASGKSKREGREIYESARTALDIWAIYNDNINLALPAHGRSYAGFDEHGYPIAWPINSGRPKSIYPRKA
jgi:hypothetical protein